MTVTTECPYCGTDSHEESAPDDCCHGAEAAALRAENDRLRAELREVRSFLPALRSNLDAIEAATTRGVSAR